MAVPVDIYVKDESPSPLAMANVEVGIFNPSTHTLVAAAVTDVNGLAAFSLPGAVGAGTSYEVRFFKAGVNFHGLFTIAVVEPVQPGAPNKFDHTGTDTNILPISSSPYLCRCTGVFLDFRGRPVTNHTIRFMAKAENILKTPKVTNGMMVCPDELEVRTDGYGRVSLDLIRTGRYEVTWGGDDDTVWCITVPDEYAANLIEMIHPFPVVWDWDDTQAPGDAATIAIAASVVIPIEVTFSDFHKASLGLETYFNLVVTGTNPAIVNTAWSNGALTVTGLASGTVTITPVLRTDILPNRWPVPTVIAPPLTITVT